MPRRNRVLPTAEIVATPERGTLLGNRGCLHRPDGTVTKPWQLERWIVCRLHYKGRHHPQAAPNRYTSLFFADEATALAAGHRPCAECRNADFKAFVAAYALAHARTQDPPKAPELDAHLHADRIADDGRSQRTYTVRLGALPPGTMVLEDQHPWLVGEHHALRRWSWPGSTSPATVREIDPRTEVTVLTPKATVATLAAGYPVRKREG